MNRSHAGYWARAAPALVLLVLAGCGGGGGASDADAVRKAVQTYFDGFADGDGSKACGVLTGERKREMTDYVGERLPELGATTCEAAVETLSQQLGSDEIARLRALRISTEVEGNHATATIAGATSQAELRRVNDRWLISAGIPS